MILSFIISLLVLLIDQLTKFLIYGLPSRSIIGNLLWFESSLNTGVAFSMFEGNSLVFAIISLVASCVFVWLICSKRFFTSRFEKVSLSLILAGTLSNAFDRLFFGGVRDFIYLKFINFAIFNVADMAITFGAGLLCILSVSVFPYARFSKSLRYGFSMRLLQVYY